MTDDQHDRYDHFRPLKSGADHLADAAASAGRDTPPPHPYTLNFSPVEVGEGYWKLPNDHHVYRGEAEARKAAARAEGDAKRAYASYVNALPVPTKTRGQELHEAYEAAKAKALSEGVTREAWEASAELRAAYFDTRTGAELMQEHKRNRR